MRDEKNQFNEEKLERTEENPYYSILQIVENVIKFDFARLYKFDSNRRKLILVAEKGTAGELLENLGFNFGKGLSAWVAEWNKPILIRKKKPTPGGAPLGSFLSFPLWLKSRLVGVLSLACTSQEGLSLKELKYSKLIREKIALLMERTEIIERLKGSYMELNRACKEFGEIYDSFHRQKQIAQEQGFEDAITRRRITDPLSVILGNAELLLKEIGKGKGELKTHLETIVAEGRKIMDSKDMQQKRA